MASATEHRPVSNGSLNGHAKGDANGSVAPKKHATSVADDDDSVSTEQFPAFDPLHDGSEEDITTDGNEHYTHAAGAPEWAGGNGDSNAEPNEQQIAAADDDDGPSTPLSTIEPVPESEHRTMTSPSITSPPYWQHGHGALGSGYGNGALSHAHHNHSAESLVPGAITLQDNEAEEDGEPTERQRNSDELRTSYGRDRNRACWAKSVEVTNYVIVNGSATNIGAFLVWNIRVETLSGPFMNIRKRYSEFDDFRHQLIRTFPNFAAAVPALPPKSVISKFRPRFLEKRRAGLQYFLNCILLNPEFSGSPVLKDFLFS
ncbi:PX domain-containing protein YPT35 [Cytospora mali]|uniref:Endosomal/vacuolar adapter protein YPT35 n=1 Tax=Cytospora mali TaxID=578113 RepID=A0A194UZN9_CYTMA|nr:PX domain-containing protein YPT35 [Valsa mali var. pyri (nom. inval.)]